MVMIATAIAVIIITVALIIAAAAITMLTVTAITLTAAYVAVLKELNAFTVRSSEEYAL